MKIYFLRAIIFFELIFSLVLFGQNENYINIIIPEEDSIITNLSKFRLAANTLPGSRVEINGKKLKVYSTGAFVDLMKLEIGENEFEIESVDKEGNRVTKSFVIFREDDKIVTSESDELIIEDALMLPNSDMWLNSGDVLNVRIKGTPGCNAMFLDTIKMVELPETETKGIMGIYTGIYKVKPSDNYENKPIIFSLQRDEEKITKKSSALISFIPEKLPRVAVTVGDRPFLNYSLGTDRLGGTKLSYLEAGIKLIIDGMEQEQYRVRLTSNQVAWIPKDLVKLLPIGTFLPKSLTESWAAFSDGLYDIVNINLTEKLPFSTKQDINPTRIIVDIYGATNNSNWITQHLTTDEIKNLYCEQVSEDLFRVIIEPVHTQIWGYEVSYSNTTLQIKIKKQPKNLNLENLTIILDAGHGGENKGALGATGLMEKDLNLAIILKLKEQLIEKGTRVLTLRDNDIEMTNSERIKKILSQNADILISIHANSIGYSTDPQKVSGTSTYYKHIAFRPLSIAIYKRMLELGLNPFGNVGNFNFALNSPTEIINVLVETAFLSNPSDELRLMNEEFQNKIARQIVQGIQDFLYECEDNLN